MVECAAEGMTIILNANIIVSAVHHYQVTRYAKPRENMFIRTSFKGYAASMIMFLFFCRRCCCERARMVRRLPIKLPLCCFLRSAKPPNLFFEPARCCSKILMDVNNWEHGSMNTLKNEFLACDREKVAEKNQTQCGKCKQKASTTNLHENGFQWRPFASQTTAKFGL